MVIVVQHWRIRLVAYVARLERGLGAIPQGFKSPILRQFNERLFTETKRHGRCNTLNKSDAATTVSHI